MWDQVGRLNAYRGGLVEDAVLAQPVRADAERLEHGTGEDNGTREAPAPRR
jgi:hypothetical protein